MDEGRLLRASPGGMRLRTGPPTRASFAPDFASDCASRVVSSMEQRRFFEVMGEESGEWLVLDGKRHPPRVICRCRGWNAPKNAALIVAALEAHHSELYSKFPLDGSGRPNEQPAVKPCLPSGEAESAPAPKPATRKSRAGHRG